MTADADQVPGASSDPEELLDEALTQARGTEPEGHAALQKHLESSAFLGKLDTPEAYEDPEGTLRIERIIEALSENPAGGAREVLVSLTQTPVFLEEPPRVDALIRACARIRPAPPEVVKFWDVHCRPLDGYTPLTIRAVFDNGSEPALALFEKKMHAPEHPKAHKIDWLRLELIKHRDDLPVLQACERLLKTDLPRGLPGALVEVLFDYRPDQWYTDEDPPLPPPRAEASPAAVQQLGRIGEYALANVKLADRPKKAVEDFLADLAEPEPEP